MQLLDAVEQAWANSALLTIRDDPALAAARALPQPTPRKAAASPLAGASSARFKVTYRRAPQAWFVIDLPTQRSLNDLHRAIQDAAEFDNDHMYAFFLSGEPQYFDFGKVRTACGKLPQHFRGERARNIVRPAVGVPPGNGSIQVRCSRIRAHQPNLYRVCRVCTVW